MTDTPEGSAATGGRDPCLDISLQPVASHLRASDGREIPFTRAILTIRNVCDAEVVDVVPHATLGQEGGTVQDVTSSLSPSAPASIPPGGTVSWDVYDLLLPAHPGTCQQGPYVRIPGGPELEVRSCCMGCNTAVRLFLRL